MNSRSRILKTVKNSMSALSSMVLTLNNYCIMIFLILNKIIARRINYLELFYLNYNYCIIKINNSNFIENFVYQINFFQNIYCLFKDKVMDIRIINKNKNINFFTIYLSNKHFFNYLSTNTNTIFENIFLNGKI